MATALARPDAQPLTLSAGLEELASLVADVHALMNPPAEPGTPNQGNDHEG